MSEPEYMVTWLGGEKKLDPILYRLTETVEKHWWRNKTLYYVESEFGRLGPFEDKADAEMYLGMAQRS